MEKCWHNCYDDPGMTSFWSIMSRDTFMGHLGKFLKGTDTGEAILISWLKFRLDVPSHAKDSSVENYMFSKNIPVMNEKSGANSKDNWLIHIGILDHATHSAVPRSYRPNCSGCGMLWLHKQKVSIYAAWKKIVSPHLVLCTSQYLSTTYWVNNIITHEIHLNLWKSYGKHANLHLPNMQLLPCIAVNVHETTLFLSSKLNVIVNQLINCHGLQFMNKMPLLFKHVMRNILGNLV